MRTDEWRYTFWAKWLPSMHPDLSAPAGEELYDHREDTTHYNVDNYEYVNLAPDPAFAETLARLRKELTTRVAAWQRANHSGVLD